MKDKKFIFSSILVATFLLTVGLTYAYFSLTVSGNDVAETINVNTTKLELKYTDGKEVKADGIEPGWTTTKTITVENKGNEETYYTLGWQKLYNEIQKDELVIRSSCTSSGVTTGTCQSTENVIISQTLVVTAETNKVVYPYKENAKILPGEVHTYTITIEFINYTDMPQNYNQGKSFYGVLGVAESGEKSILADYLIENYQTLGLTKIDQAATGNQNYATTEYRYQGKDPNNYITFNDETGVWRIIGALEVETPQTDGTYIKEYKVKIVRDSLENGKWGSVSANDWTSASLMTTFNSGDYYNRSGSYSETGLTENAKNQISSTKWYLGNAQYGVNTQKVYSSERSTSVQSGNKQTWDGKVALIYPSDYMYASSACYNDDTKKGWDTNGISPFNTDYRSETCKSTGWLLDTNQWYWAISPNNFSSDFAMVILSEGYMRSYSSYRNSGGIRPSLYLNASVNYISGSGSNSDPFIIG